MRVKFCPNCGSKEIELVAGGNIGMYECKNCGFMGSIFPEIDVKEKSENKLKKKARKKKK